MTSTYKLQHTLLLSRDIFHSKLKPHQQEEFPSVALNLHAFFPFVFFVPDLLLGFISCNLAWCKQNTSQTKTSEKKSLIFTFCHRIAPNIFCQHTYVSSGWPLKTSCISGTTNPASLTHTLKRALTPERAQGFKANFCCGKTLVLQRHMMPLCPKILFPIDLTLHCERVVCKPVDRLHFFERHNFCEMTLFTVRI